MASNRIQNINYNLTKQFQRVLKKEWRQFVDIDFVLVCPESIQPDEICTTCKCLMVNPVYYRSARYCSGCLPPDHGAALLLDYWKYLCMVKQAKCKKCAGQCSIADMQTHLIYHCNWKCPFHCGKETMKYSQWKMHLPECRGGATVHCPFALFIREQNFLDVPHSCSWQGAQSELKAHLKSTGCAQFLAVANYFLARTQETELKDAAEVMTDLTTPSLSTIVEEEPPPLKKHKGCPNLDNYFPDLVQIYSKALSSAPQKSIMYSAMKYLHEYFESRFDLESLKILDRCTKSNLQAAKISLDRAIMESKVYSYDYRSRTLILA